MVTRVALSVVAIAVAGCGARSHHGAAAAPGDELTLYRDRALISQRVDVEVAPAEKTTVRVSVPAGLTADDVVVIDRGGLTVSELRAVGTGRVFEPPAQATENREGEEREPPPAPVSRTPTELTFVVGAPQAGHFVLHLGYVTPQIQWGAAYTMTTTAARDRVSMRGAIAIANSTGITFKRARVFVVDAPLVTWRGRIAEQLGSALIGTTASTSPLAVPRDLGQVELGPDETRLELLPGDPPRKMRSVLVYDPIGTTLDHGGESPIRDATLGVNAATPARITESFEIARPEGTSAGLPAGPVRLLERHPDGSLAVLGEARLFDVATRVAEVDTVAIGTAEGVTGRRERRDMTVDDDRKRLVEEFVVTIKNTRARPVEIVIREHLYRGQNWSLAYYSTPIAAKEGPQQISLRGDVAANGETKVLYVVVYTWR
jgi:hypothetical protein